jgi:hypothetical protein
VLKGLGIRGGNHVVAGLAADAHDPREARRTLQVGQGKDLGERQSVP